MGLFEMSVAGGALIAGTVVIRALALHRLPKTTFFLLWMVAALRLLLPFSIPLPFHISMGQHPLLEVVQALFASVAQGESIPSYGMGTAAPSPAAEPISTFKLLWLVGVLLLALYFTISYFRSMQKFRMSIPDHTPYIQAWLTTHQIVRPIEVRNSDLISSPLTYGILHPVILLPKRMDRGNQAALQYVLTHEYVHIRRFDAITKLLFAAVLCIHWFNPLVWVMYVLANQDLELSCDAWVIRMMGEKNRSSYAMMLIGMEETRSGISALCSHFGKNAITERIEAIMKFKKASTAACVLALVMVVGATTAFASSSAPWKEVDLQDLNLVEGEIGTEYSGMKLIDYTQVQMHELENLNPTTETDTVDLETLPYEEFSKTATNTWPMETQLISVSHDDKSKFTPEKWTEILKQIEQGTVYWED